jgi:hypothetical protein
VGVLEENKQLQGAEERDEFVPEEVDVLGIEKFGDFRRDGETLMDNGLENCQESGEKKITTGEEIDVGIEES